MPPAHRGTGPGVPNFTPDPVVLKDRFECCGDVFDVHFATGNPCAPIGREQLKSGRSVGLDGCGRLLGRFPLRLPLSPRFRWGLGFHHQGLGLRVRPRYPRAVVRTLYRADYDRFAPFRNGNTVGILSCQDSAIPAQAKRHG